MEEHSETWWRNVIEGVLKVYDSREVRALVGEAYVDMTFGTLPPPQRKDHQNALMACRQFCDHWESVVEKGQGLYLYSPKAGTGKTSLLACMRNDLVHRGCRCAFANAAELMKQAQNRGSVWEGSRMYSYSMFMNVDVLLLDDIGVQNLKPQNGFSEWVQEEMYYIIDHRCKNRKSTVFSSNYSPNQLNSERGYDFKTVDRIHELSSLVLRLDGDSFRGHNNRSETT